jgi:cellulose synthase/poly-beta-1,6-N-acetylglucosamine synthase-like glycosyltransferase
MGQVTEQFSKGLNVAAERPNVRGKFLCVGDEKFWVKGVTYGTFAQDENGIERFIPSIVEKDFATIAENGFNVLRTYTVPPRWVLDVAWKHGLRVMVGIPVEVPMALIDESGKPHEIEDWVRKQLRTCAGHPAVFCYTIGNEIAPAVVRWHGRRRVEKFLERLYRLAKQEDPGVLVTYVNFPTTEYLQLPFLDFLCFNVYLETQGALEAYIARLHNLSNDRPLLLAEIGLDSLRNGEEKQAETLNWQARTVFSAGCCGAIIYGWTDEWYRWGNLVQDWSFGLTTRDRTPKPALQAVKNALAESPFSTQEIWPRISVVVCSFNGSPTIRDTLNGLLKLDYPSFEVIVVNDGSTDSTPKITSEYPFKLINTENRGLSNARNTGIEAATGEIIAFVDDDAYPDDHWLRFLALAFKDGTRVGVGGPNLPVPEDGWKSEAVANSPGPNPVLLTDRVAEHIPGCNMAFKKDALNEIGGFDPAFRTAGDDVDLCWRIRESGGVIGYSPAAVVWHHRRNSFRKYWKQQDGYGKAESLLEKKWPEKYNEFGQLKWLGRIYGKGVSQDFSSMRERVFFGVWGTAPFQSLYQSSNSLWSLTLAPEWYLATGFLALVFLLTMTWSVSIIPGALFSAGLATSISQALMNAHSVRTKPESRLERIRLRAAIFFMQLLQPLARLEGRLGSGLMRWNWRWTRTRPRFVPLTMKLWRDEWQDSKDTLKDLRSKLRDSGTVVKSGGDYDRWDLEVREGRFGGCRLLLATQSYGAGRQLLRYRIIPRYSGVALAMSALFVVILVVAVLSGAWIPGIVSGSVGGILIARTILETGFASDRLLDVLRHSGAF